MTLPRKVENVQVAPAYSWPSNVTVPWQRGPPPSAPVARNASGPADGRLVTPGVIENVPVGATGVPAHVQVSGRRACPAGAGSPTATTARPTVNFAPALIPCLLRC